MLKFASLWSAVAIVAVVMSFTSLATNRLTAATTTDNPISQMLGYWSGHARITTSDGETKAFKCSVTYRSSQDSTTMQQKLRCRNNELKFESVTLLRFSGDKVSGRWEEKSHNLSGEVIGNITDEGFDVHLGGKFFQANMRVSSSACEQLVEVTPVQTDKFKELSASLKRRCT